MINIIQRIVIFDIYRKKTNHDLRGNNVKEQYDYYEKKYLNNAREFDSWISEKSTCRSHKTCFFCVKFLVFIYCILLQCVVKYNKGGILHASYYIEI